MSPLGSTVALSSASIWLQYGLQYGLQWYVGQYGI